MDDTQKPGTAKPALERFEISETGLTAHLTDEQKTWKVVKLRPRSERFAVLAAEPSTEQAQAIESGISELVGAVRRLLDLGAKPEAVAEAVAGVLGNKG